MIRAVVSLAVLLAAAPVQCPHEADAEHCWDDAPGDGLWELAQKFRDAHDDAGARRTLRFLVDRYPSSRYAPAAREQLRRGAVPGEGDSGA